MKTANTLTPALALFVLGLATTNPSIAASKQAPASGQTQTDAFDAARHERGRKIYNFRCYYCHGYSGDARTLAASYLTPPPRDFTAAPTALSRDAMQGAITHGRPGTAMKGFAGILTADEITLVADFVRREFMLNKAPNTHYHTPANGWPNHERYRAAFPFAQGEIALDTPWDKLSPAQQAGKRLFMTSCVSCHDRARVTTPGAVWEARALSYPRGGFSLANPPVTPPKVDALTTASPYLIHDQPRQIAGLNATERRGEMLFQQNCAFCHAADGTGKNWIGSFMEPHPRDLTSKQAMAGMTRARLAKVIAEGLPDTSMPAWRDVLTPDEIQAVIAYISRAFYAMP